MKPFVRSYIVKQRFYKKIWKTIEKHLRFNVVFVLLLVGSLVLVLFSFSIVNGNNSYSQFTHLLQSLPDGGNAAATQSQSSENLATQSSFSSSPSDPPYSSSSIA